MDNSRSYTPFRFRELNGGTIITNEAGNHKFYKNGIIERFFSNQLNSEEFDNLKSQSIIVTSAEDWRYLSLSRSTQLKRAEESQKLSYLIIIPTLRCDLSCSYCQVSRAPVNASGFDWTPETLENFSLFISEKGSDNMKVEFQGGEPTLRTDLIEKIIQIIESKYKGCEFVICSNLTNLSDSTRKLLSKNNVEISTSIDGPESTMTENRTFDSGISEKVLTNINTIISEYGHSKIAALPTITENQINDPKRVIDYYRDLGFNSIFLRPVNYQGFARKAHSSLSREINKWNTFYTEAMEYILEISENEYFEEFYTGTLIRKIFTNRESGFVDYRSPASYAQEYCVIDYDGKIYPTDESRMLSRTRHVDLCIGNLEEGINHKVTEGLNFNAIHHTHEDCTHCAYMPYCGIDLIDDLSRYNRFDLPKHMTWYCNRHLFLFDFIFEKIMTWDTRWLSLFNSWIHRSRNTSNALEVFL